MTGRTTSALLSQSLRGNRPTRERRKRKEKKSQAGQGLLPNIQASKKINPPPPRIGCKKRLGQLKSLHISLSLSVSAAKPTPHLAQAAHPLTQKWHRGYRRVQAEALVSAWPTPNRCSRGLLFSACNWAEIIGTATSLRPMRMKPLGGVTEESKRRRMQGGGGQACRTAAAQLCVWCGRCGSGSLQQVGRGRAGA